MLETLRRKFQELQSKQVISPAEYELGAFLTQQWFSFQPLSRTQLKKYISKYFVCQPLNLFPISFFWFSNPHYVDAIALTVNYLLLLQNPSKAQICLIEALVVLDIQFKSDPDLNKQGLLEIKANSALPENRITQEIIGYFLESICPLFNYKLSASQREEIAAKVVTQYTLQPLINFLLSLPLNANNGFSNRSTLISMVFGMAAISLISFNFLTCCFSQLNNITNVGVLGSLSNRWNSTSPPFAMLSNTGTSTNKTVKTASTAPSPSTGPPARSDVTSKFAQAGHSPTVARNTRVVIGTKKHILALAEPDSNGFKIIPAVDKFIEGMIPDNEFDAALIQTRDSYKQAIK